MGRGTDMAKRKPKTIYTTRELADALGLTNKYVVHKWIRNNYIPSFRIGGSQAAYVAIKDLRAKHPVLVESMERSAHYNEILGERRIRPMYRLADVAEITGLAADHIQRFADLGRIKTFSFRPRSTRYVLFADLEEVNPEFCEHFVEAAQLAQSG